MPAPPTPALPLLLAMGLFTSATVPRSKAAPPPPLIVAHRGDSAHAPENTLASLRAAVKARADLAEFDVRQTADGALLVFHDADLRRYTGAKTVFETLTAEQARQVDVGAGFDPGKTFAGEKMPTLREAIETCLAGEGGAPATPLIERKSGPAAAYAALLREMGVADRVIVQAFDWDFLRDLRALAPEIVLGALGDKAPDVPRLAELATLKPQWVGWNQKYLTRDGIAAFHAAGFKVAVWTVNDLAGLRQFKAWGADALITDRPGEAREAVE